jgi:hypothetical protein
VAILVVYMLYILCLFILDWYIWDSSQHRSRNGVWLWDWILWIAGYIFLLFERTSWKQYNHQYHKNSHVCTTSSFFDWQYPFILLLTIISQRDVKHIMTLPIKIITSLLKVSTYIITIISALLIGTIARLVIINLETKTMS